MHWLLLPLLLLATAAGQNVESAQFLWREDSGSQAMVVFWDAHHLRVDLPERRFSILCDTRTDDFIGLEHRDARFWRFNWKQLQTIVTESRQNARKLKTPLVKKEIITAPAPPPPPLVWKKTDSVKTIHKLEARLWEGADEHGRLLQAWCSTMPGGPSLELWQQLCRTQDILKLVAVRPMGPHLTPAQLAALPAEAGAPLEIILGEQEESPRLTFQNIPSAPNDPARFQPPAHYKLDPLAAIEGME